MLATSTGVRSPLQTLHDAIKHSTIRYAPRYQRGFKKHQEKGDADYDLLLPIDHPELQIDPKRAQAMAVKFLQGRLYTSHVTWDARVKKAVRRLSSTRRPERCRFRHRFRYPTQDTGTWPISTWSSGRSIRLRSRSRSPSMTCR